MITNLSSVGNTQDWDNFTVTAVPEPATMSLLGVSCLLLGVRRRKA